MRRPMMEKSGKDSHKKPQEVGISRKQEAGAGLPAIDASSNNSRSQRQSIGASEELYKLLVKAAGQAGHGIVVLQNTDDREGAIVFINVGFAGALGYTEHELLGMTISDLVCPEDLPVVAERYAQRQKGDNLPSCYEMRALRRDGTKVPLEVSAVTVVIDGQVSTMAFLRDISQQVQLVESLEQNERRYHLLAENISDVFWVTDTNLKPIHVSPSIVHLLGYTVEEVLGRTLPDFLTPASSETAAVAFSQVLYQSRRDPSFEPPPLEVELVHKDGSTVWVESNISFVRGPDGQVVEAVGVLHDVTQRKKAEQAIRDSEGRYRLLAENLRDVIFTSDLNLRVTYISPSVTRLLGFTVEEAESRSVEETFTPESLSIAMKAAEDLVESSRTAIEPGASSAGRLEMIRKDGSTVWTEAEVSLLRGADGRPDGFLGVIRDISKRKIAEDRLQESEETYRRLVENIDAVIYSVDENGVTTYISPTFKMLFGTDPAELVGKRFADFVHPEDLSRSLENLRKVMSDTLTEPWECRMVLPGTSQIYWVQGHNRPIYKDGTIVGFQGVLVDITDRRQAEEAIQISERKYRTLVESSPDGILSIDTLQHIVECNEGICRLLGYAKEEIKGADVRKVTTSSTLERGDAFTQQVDEHGCAEAELELLHRDGHSVPVWVKMVGMQGAKQSDYQILAYLRDIEERKKLDELKDQFIGLVSHELRTPLTVIVGAVNTVLTESPRLSPRETRRLLEDAASEAELLSDILENLLELSRSRAERLTLHLEPVVLQEVVESAVDKARRRSLAHKFVMDLPGTLPPMHADRIRLERVLHNLLDNAVKYSPEGEVRVSASRKGRNVIIEVHDQGPGISPEDQGALFQPFHRVERGDEEGVQGIGLGLLVCRSLVEAHGGRIWVESDPGQGTSFLFSLPADGRRPKRNRQ
jgi:PAS domain S-box-containing protein